MIKNILQYSFKCYLYSSVYPNKITHSLNLLTEQKTMETSACKYRAYLTKYIINLGAADRFQSDFNLFSKIIPNK